MDQAKSKVSVFCPDHEDQLLVRANPDLNAQKHIYCVECLMQTEDPRAAYANLPKISDFRTTIANTFTDHKEKIQTVSEEPKEFFDVDASQAESLEKLSKHIDKEKKKIETFFDNITNVVVDVLCQLKDEHLKMLDKQVTDLHDKYVEFEQIFKRFYPKKEDIGMLFPTKEELEEKLSKVNTALELEMLIKSLKRTAATSKDVFSGNFTDEWKKDFLKRFKNSLNWIENNTPTSEETGLTFQTAKDEIKKYLDQLIGVGKVFTFKNTITPELPKPSPVNSFPQSTIIASEEFRVLKEWLPNNNKFDPALLYRMTRDGRSSDAFHSRCDKKGSTIILIKCKYEGASQPSVIGGFSDKDFDRSRNGYVSSDKAFIFSFTPQIKCSIMQPSSAIYKDERVSILFGNGGAIVVFVGLDKGSSYISQSNKTYADSEKIIPPECYKGTQVGHTFQIEEIEVYQVS